jgi:hypothetical protein
MIVQPGNGYGFSSSGYGVSLDIGNPFPDLGDSEVQFLNPSLEGDKVSVSPGTVNRYIPTMGGVYLDDSTPPTITITGAGHVLVRATYESGKFFPRTATIVFESGSTPPADTNTDSYFPLAKVNSTSGVYSIVKLSSGNLVVNRLKAGDNTATWWWQAI